MAGIIGCGTGDYTRPSGTLPAVVADGKPCVEATGIPVATTPPGTDPAGSTVPPATVDKPAVSMPLGPPPTELKITDIKVGDGAEAKVGDNITVDFTAIKCSDGRQFESSYDEGEKLTAPLVEAPQGQGGMPKGLVQGITGMKVGGRRHVVIPPALAYGDKPPRDDVLPGETIIYLIDLVEATTPPPTTTAPPTTAAPAPPGTTGTETPTTTAPAAAPPTSAAG